MTRKIEKLALLAKKMPNQYTNRTYISNFTFRAESCKMECAIKSWTVQISKYRDKKSKSREKCLKYRTGTKSHDISRRRGPRLTQVTLVACGAIRLAWVGTRCTDRPMLWWRVRRSITDLFAVCFYDARITMKNPSRSQCFGGGWRLGWDVIEDWGPK